MQIPSDLTFGVRLQAPQPRVFSDAHPESTAAEVESVVKLADTAEKVAFSYEERAADLERVRKFTEITTEMNRQVADLDVKMQDWTDHESYMEAWEKEHKEIKAGVMKAARVDPFVYKAVTEYASRNYNHEYSKQKTNQRNLQVGNIKASEDDASYIALQTVQTVQDAERVYHYLNVINDANETFKGPVEHAKRRREIPQEIAVALISHLRMTDPEKAVQLLDDKDSLVSLSLPLDKRVVLSKAIQDEMWTKEQRDQKRYDDLMENNEQYVEDWIRTGEIDLEKLNEMRDMGGFFRPDRQTYEHFRNQILNYQRGEFDDGAVVFGLERDLYDPRTTHLVTAKRVRSLEASGQLSAASASKMMKKVRDVREAETRLPDGFSQGLKVIQEHIAPSMFSLNPSLDEVKMYTPLAREYREWVMRNMSSTASEQLKKAYEIIDRMKSRPKPAAAEGKMSNPYKPKTKDLNAILEAMKQMRIDYAKESKKKPGEWKYTQQQFWDWYNELDEMRRAD